MASGPNSSKESKKHNFLKELSQFRIHQKNLEKERLTHIFNKRGEFYGDLQNLDELEQKNAEQRQQYIIRLQQQLSVIKGKVKRFEKELQDVKPNPQAVEKIKTIMEDVESSISSFKEQQKNEFDQLIKDEKITTLEIDALDKKFETWNAIPLKKETKVPRGHEPTVERDITLDLPPEVAAFERFVEQSGGPRAGWDEYDHTTFLKYRVKRKGKPGFIRDLIPNLPTKSEQEVIEHERWYLRYLELNEEKKNGIQKWREKKEMEKETLLAQAQADDSDEEEKKKEKTEAEQKQKQGEKIERMRELNKWKIEKELQKAEEEQRKLRQKLTEQQKEAERKQEQEELRKQVEEYKKKKDLEKTAREYEERQKEQGKTKEKKKVAELLIERFQNRDQQVLERKQRKEQMKEFEEKEKEERLQKLKSKVEVQVQRDPNRVLQPTKGWMERQKDDGQSDHIKGPILHVQHRAVPSWRQGIH